MNYNRIEIEEVVKELRKGKAGSRKMNYNRIEIEEVVKELRKGKAGSRKEKIIDLLESLNQKNYDETLGGMALWLQTWIFPRLFKLIPELKKCRKDEGGESK